MASKQYFYSKQTVQSPKKDIGSSALLRTEACPLAAIFGISKKRREPCDAAMFKRGKCCRIN
jgi:hypothetical protein